MTTESLLLIVLISVCIILLIIVLILVLSRNTNNSKIETSLNRDLLNFSKNLNDSFNSLSNQTNNRLDILQERINQNLQTSYKTSNEYFNQISIKMAKIDEAQNSLKDLSTDINSLQSILQDKKSRGTFGEIELYSLLESVFGLASDRWAKQYTLSNNARADALIFGGENIGNIVIDSKFPLESYRRLYDETIPKTEKEKIKVQFKNDVFKHLKDIKDKYIIEGETAEVAYMFVPAEAVFAEIYGNYQEIVEKSYEYKVYIVSPTTLMAYLTAIRSIYLGQKKDEKAKEIAKLLAELSVEFNRFAERQFNLKKDFEKIIPDFDSVLTTSNKIIKRFEKINNGDIDD